MSLVVETGAGLANSNTFASVATADAYFEARNNATWAALSDEDKEAALLYSTAWLCDRYKWAGSILTTTQALAWPRGGAVDREGRYVAHTIVPQRVIDATCEAALLHSQGQLVQSSLDRGGQIASEAAGPVSVSYFEGAPSERSFPQIDALLAGLAASPAAGFAVVPLLRG